MYAEHPSFIQPDNEDIKVWRYIDFTKLVSMLSSRSLYFARSDKLGDPFEGSYPKLNVLMREQLFKQQVDEKGDTKVMPIPEQLERLAEGTRKHLAINCWHMNEFESAAMWKLYLSSNEGVAIQSTYLRLKNCFVGKDDVLIGVVRYLDYKKERIENTENFFEPFMHKRRSFEHESEVRAIVLKRPYSRPGPEVPVVDLSVVSMEHGTPIEVDLGILVERIYVAPDAPRWFSELVKSINHRFGYKFEVIDSQLSDRPLF